MKKNKVKTETATIKFQSIDDVYSKYSTDKHKVLDNNASTFISESFKDMQTKSKKVLEIYLEKPCTDKEKSECKSVIRKYYKNDYNDYKEENVKLAIVSFILLFIGVAFIISLAFLNSISTPYTITIILEIIAWVFIWEFVDVFVFARFTNHIKMNKIKQIIDCEIVFK